jgi:tetratricopeptide (TPR) repeat protein
MDTPTPAPSRLERLGRYLAADPGNVPLLQDYAAEAWAARETEACLQALRRLQSQDTIDAPHSGLLGRVLLARGEIDSAVSELQHALQRWPDSALLRFELARCLFAAREIERALAQLPDEPATGGLGAAVCALRVRLLHHAGRLDEAVAAAQHFEAEAGAQPGVECAMLPLLVDLDRLDEARRRAQGLADAHPGSIPYEACEPLAIAALDEGRAAEAGAWVDRALRLRSDDGRIWLLAALARLQQGEAAAADEAVARAVELMPRHAGSHLAQGWIALLQDDRAGARTAFERGIEASPAFADGHGSLAVVAALQGHADEADALVRKALLLDKACASALFAQSLRRGTSPERVQELARVVLARARGARRAPQ